MRKLIFCSSANCKNVSVISQNKVFLLSAAGPWWDLLTTVGCCGGEKASIVPPGQRSTDRRKGLQRVAWIFGLHISIRLLITPHPVWAAFVCLKQALGTTWLDGHFMFCTGRWWCCVAKPLLRFMCFKFSPLVRRDSHQGGCSRQLQGCMGSASQVCEHRSSRCGGGRDLAAGAHSVRFALLANKAAAPEPENTACVPCHLHMELAELAGGGVWSQARFPR